MRFAICAIGLGKTANGLVIIPFDAIFIVNCECNELFPLPFPPIPLENPSASSLLCLVYVVGVNGRAAPFSILDSHSVFHRTSCVWRDSQHVSEAAVGRIISYPCAFPKQRWVGSVAMAYAFYVGVGVPLTSCFSDFAARAIIGSVI